MIRFWLATLAFVSYASLTPAMAKNYIVNGDFEAGNVGFTGGDLTYKSGLPGSARGADTYTIATSGAAAANAEAGWDAVGDHTTGHGKELIVSRPGFFTTVYSQDVGLDPNKLYDWSVSFRGLNSSKTPTFFTWYPTLYPQQGPVNTFEMIVGGAPAPSVFRDWQTFTGTFQGGPTFAIGIIGPTTARLGPMGLAIDDIMVTDHDPSVPEPTTWALMIAGFGAGGATMRQGRRPARG